MLSGSWKHFTEFIQRRFADDITIIESHSVFSIKFGCHMLPFSISQNNKCRTCFDSLFYLNEKKTKTLMGKICKNLCTLSVANKSFTRNNMAIQ